MLPSFKAFKLQKCMITQQSSFPTFTSCVLTSIINKINLVLIVQWNSSHCSNTGAIKSRAAKIWPHDFQCWQCKQTEKHTLLYCTSIQCKLSTFTSSFSEALVINTTLTASYPWFRKFSFTSTMCDRHRNSNTPVPCCDTGASLLFLVLTSWTTSKLTKISFLC